MQNTLKLSGDLQNINVYDLSGKVILRNCSGKEFNVTTLSSGIYNLTGVNNKGEITKFKFIKK
ncbi:T9SS type A sorting domain-containing protein [Chryseobacterium sp.]|uniref:T9SS type A sorting domain-containing protein n=1 Tax=Chryseobacterium sp. TaxID=1871047 RepID=UPI002896A62D|nr:T9SS type A sorting domain-containing protein [Chryseobacterium sp.]